MLLIGVTQFTGCRWPKKFDGHKTDRVKRLKEPEKESEPLRKEDWLPAVLNLIDPALFEARTGIGRWIDVSDTRRPHTPLGGRIPATASQSVRTTEQPDWQAKSVA